MLLLSGPSNEPEYPRQHLILCHGDSTVGRASRQRRHMAAWYFVISTMYFQLVRLSCSCQQYIELMQSRETVLI